MLLLQSFTNITLPTLFLQLETSEGFNDYMYEIGVDWFTRKIGCSLYPTTKIGQVENKISIGTKSTFKAGELQFKLGVPFEEETADGRTVTTTAMLVGDKLTKHQVAADGAVSSIETRQFSAGGQKMTLIHTIPGNSYIKSVRVYKRVKDEIDTEE